MPAKRKTELPLGEGYFDYVLWNPFFDSEVRSVLASRKRVRHEALKPKHIKPETTFHYRGLEYIVPGTIDFLLAWPIKAYKEISALVYDMPKYWDDSSFGTFYGWDAEFIADLLQAITCYKNKPETDWRLMRAITECPRVAPAETRYKNLKALQLAASRFTSFAMQREFLRLVEECPDGSFKIKNWHRIQLRDIPPEGLNTQQLIDFKQIEEIINENFPHLHSELNQQDEKEDGSKRKKTPADKIRTYFERERKKRQKIVEHWRLNFDAEARFLIPEDLSLLPCYPDPDFYESRQTSQNCR